MWILDTADGSRLIGVNKGQWLISNFKKEIEALLTKWFTEGIQAHWKTMRCAELESNGPIVPDLLSDQFDLKVRVQLELVKKQVQEPKREAAQ